ncbi:MAG: polysaccharide biosynthesis protein [Bacteroidales bacterium]|nr:polysaccharide biosynthesis protein [Bacteroidales bacterium]
MLGIGKNLDKFSTKFLGKGRVLAMDLTLSLLVSVVIAVFAFFMQADVAAEREFDLLWGLSSVAGSALMFWLLKTYVIIIRHFSFKDTMLFFIASVGKASVMALVMALWGFFSCPGVLTMLLSDIAFTLIVLCGVRLLMIYVYDAYKFRVRELQKRSRVLIYGINDKAVATAARLRGSKRYEVVGLISKDTQIVHTLIADKEVYHFDDQPEFELAVRNLSLRGVIFTRESDVAAEQNDLVRYCSELGVKVLIAPAVDELTGAPNERMQIRKIKIEDLLGREEIKISMDAIRANFKDKVVMVTGSAGSIGSELCRQLASFGIRKLVLFDNAETPMHNLRLELEERFPELSFVPIIGDVRQAARLDFAFRVHRPQVVFHAAAYKHVPLMEENPCEAVLVNVDGTRNVADKCIEYGVEKMVMISTDKAVNPTNVMGCSKRLAEIYVQSLGKAIEAGKVEGHTKFVTTRFGNVLGSNGSVIPRFREQIERGGPITVTDKEITRYFMTIPEACRLVMEAATLPTENRICVFDMGQPVKIDTLARRMIELAGLVPDQDIEIVYTGLRPGEKLYEEVLSTKENTDETSHDRIRIARVREYDYSEAVKAADELTELSHEVRVAETVCLMKKIVPEFVSNNSRFSEFDKK